MVFLLRFLSAVPFQQFKHLSTMYWHVLFNSSNVKIYWLIDVEASTLCIISTSLSNHKQPCALVSTSHCFGLLKHKQWLTQQCAAQHDSFIVSSIIQYRSIYKYMHAITPNKERHSSCNYSCSTIVERCLSVHCLISFCRLCLGH